ncbi:MAG: acireductone synthase [Betaproteobacteria bacterium]
MSAAIRAPAAVVVDIEGTVGSIRFVKDVLFPYARARLRPFVLANRTRPDVARQLEAVRSETGIAEIDGQIDQLERWSDADRKITPLKALQGSIWAGGYESGDLVAHLYDDAVAALKRWAEARLPVYVYSSGSIAAQKLYFAHSRAGDLTPGLAGYFDTTTGPKQDAESYRRIAAAIGRPAAGLLFLSDVAAELDAAAAAGWQAVQVRREPPAGGLFEPSIAKFDELPI